MRGRRVAPDVDGQLQRIHGDKLAAAPLSGLVGRALGLLAGLEDLPEAAEIELLLRESIAPHLLAPDDLADRLRRLEQPDGIVLVDELLGRQVHQTEELPPCGLVFAAMPTEELGEQPAAVL